MDRKSILIVEDEPSIAEVVSLYLQRAGFQTQHASDGKTALTLLDEQIPELAIIDIMLPEIDGLSLTRWIRDRRIGGPAWPSHAALCVHTAGILALKAQRATEVVSHCPNKILSLL